MNQLSALFPDGVAYDSDTGEITIKASLSQDQQVALAFFRLYSESSDVLDNLNVVIRDMFSLAVAPPGQATEGDRRYILLTRLFFYEIARLRDILSRFMKRLQTSNVVGKSERKETAQKIQRLFDEHYLIRNIFIHGSSFPRTRVEQDLTMLANLERAGYAPSLVPKGGGIPVEYPGALRKLAVDRSDAFYKIGSNTFRLIQSIMTVLALYVAHHHLNIDISQSASQSETGGAAGED